MEDVKSLEMTPDVAERVAEIRSLLGQRDTIDIELAEKFYLLRDAWKDVGYVALGDAIGVDRHEGWKPGLLWERLIVDGGLSKADLAAVGLRKADLLIWVRGRATVARALRIALRLPFSRVEGRIQRLCASRKIIERRRAQAAGG